jgi:hypothetical protein
LTGIFLGKVKEISANPMQGQPSARLMVALESIATFLYTNNPRIISEDRDNLRKQRELARNEMHLHLRRKMLAD